MYGTSESSPGCETWTINKTRRLDGVFVPWWLLTIFVDGTGDSLLVLPEERQRDCLLCLEWSLLGVGELAGSDLLDLVRLGNTFRKVIIDERSL